MLPRGANLFLLTRVQQAIRVKSEVAGEAPETFRTATDKSFGALLLALAAVPARVWIAGGFPPLTRWACKTKLPLAKPHERQNMRATWDGNKNSFKAVRPSLRLKTLD